MNQLVFDDFIPAEWRPPEPGTWPDFRDAKRIGLDVETYDPNLPQLGCGVRRDGYMIGISLAIEDGPKHYFPFDHAGGDNLDRKQVLGYFKEQFKTFKGDVVGANLPYDLEYCWSAGIEMPQVHRFYDIQVADPLIFELEMRYSLDAIAKRR